MISGDVVYLVLGNGRAGEWSVHGRLAPGKRLPDPSQGKEVTRHVPGKRHDPGSAAYVNQTSSEQRVRVFSAPFDLA